MDLDYEQLRAIRNRFLSCSDVSISLFELLKLSQCIKYPCSHLIIIILHVSCDRYKIKFESKRCRLCILHCFQYIKAAAVWGHYLTSLHWQSTSQQASLSIYIYVLILSMYNKMTTYRPMKNIVKTAQIFSPRVICGY